ncbi:F-box/FBD/LRR-repeat protein At1g13570-like isoform X2 [Trifolium pratense]|uniref:Uncharacterized protein n=1 Tax=Trifolium pratense TaxID=57577 RepID=A0ACB0LZU4_TRIPR|nr:F-box/FBD/LRR-repeat protein At1g13570-like isoform X2 [Trifolium pratense]CAJ2675109.1 unnamed protein product [Trifolium pratense]
MGRKQTKSTRRKLTGACTEPDRISCLPGHIIDRILSHLPIKEAVRTSVLSSKWMNKWYTIPNLVFDRKCISAIASEDPLVFESKYLKIVDHVLLLHTGPINMFKFSDCGRDFISESVVTDIARWIRHLIGRSIKELVLEVVIEERYKFKLPRCLFSCQSLQRIKLYSGWLKPPTTFKGFRNLKILELYHITITQNALENLISSCPILEHLTLIGLDDLTEIKIHAPNLKILGILGEFVDFSFENTFQLTELSLLFHSQRNQSRLSGCSSNLLKFSAHLPHIQHLDISSGFLKVKCSSISTLNFNELQSDLESFFCFVQYLAAGVVPVMLPTPCINLRFLFMCIRFNDMNEVLAALCLLRSSPNLQKLEIIAEHGKQTILPTPDSYCWEEIFSGPAVPISVRHVNIEGISGIKFELDFIRFLLMYSSVLEKMIVKPGLNVRPELMTELIRFKRASGQAEVIYNGEDSVNYGGEDFP